MTAKKVSPPPLRLRQMANRLASAYGPQHWWPAESPFEVVLGAYLTQNTAWTSVVRSLDNLRRAGALSIDGIAALSLDQLRGLIRPSGFAVRKAAAIKNFVNLLNAEFGGSLATMAAVPTTALEQRLLALPGVGPETAGAILLYALDHPIPVADEYLRRIVERHHLLPPPLKKTRRVYEQLVQLTRDGFAPDPPADHRELFNEFHALTVAVGKAHCGRIARCAGCPLAADLENL